MHVRFTAQAEADLEQIHAYIRQLNPRAADRVIDRLLTAAFNLEEFPFLGRPGRLAGWRELVVTGTPYLLFYSFPDDFHIDIDRILHGARKFPPQS